MIGFRDIHESKKPTYTVLVQKYLPSVLRKSPVSTSLSGACMQHDNLNNSLILNCLCEDSHCKYTTSTPTTLHTALYRGHPFARYVECPNIPPLLPSHLLYKPSTCLLRFENTALDSRSLTVYREPLTPTPPNIPLLTLPLPMSRDTATKTTPTPLRWTQIPRTSCPGVTTPTRWWLWTLCWARARSEKSTRAASERQTTCVLSNR